MSLLESRGSNAHRQCPLIKWALGWAFGVCLALASLAHAQEISRPPIQELAVPASFLKNVQLPGEGDSILRPRVAHFDAFHGELLVSDSGHNRILVFGREGTYKFEFSLGEAITAARDIVTDADGYIYVLGSRPGARFLFRFDFDGAPLGPVALPDAVDGAPLALHSATCDPTGRMFLLDHKNGRICRFDRDGTILDIFSLAPGLGNSVVREQGFGPLTAADGQLLIPVSTLGTVLRFTPDGDYIGSIGYQGTTNGTLNFPVAVEVSPEGAYLVLDKNRFCVVAYDAGGRFLGEFGGKGINPGWFYHPSLLAVPASDRVVVGQIFRNKIQICELPAFIRDGARQAADSRTSFNRGAAPTTSDAKQSAITPQRRSTDSLSLTHHAGEAPTSSSLHTGSHLEVSE